MKGKKLSMHSMEYYSVIIHKELASHTDTSINLKCIVVSAKSQSAKAV